MKIPSDAILAPEKLTQYLLVFKTRNDKSQYLGRAGFDLTNPSLLETEIRRLTSQCEAVVERAIEHGVYYSVSGELTGPSGVAIRVKLVWLHRLDGVFAFVTLIPEPGNC